MTFRDRIIHASTLLAIVLVGTLTLTCVAHSAISMTTANATITTYSLVAGASSKPITPVTSQSVLVMGVCTTSGNRGVGYINLLHVPSNFLEWEGQNSPNSGSTVSGFSATANTAMVFIDFAGGVRLDVNSADTFVVHNVSGGTQTGSVTMIW